MIERFRLFLDVFGTGRTTNEQERRVCRWVRHRKSRVRKMEAWNTFTAERNLQEIVSDMNETWIDPEYQIWIDRTGKVQLGKKITVLAVAA